MDMSGWGARDINIPAQMAREVGLVEARGGLLNPLFHLVGTRNGPTGRSEERIATLGGWSWVRGRPQALVDFSQYGKIGLSASSGSVVSRWRVSLGTLADVDVLDTEFSALGSRVFRTPTVPGSVRIEFGRAGGKLARLDRSGRNSHPLVSLYGPGRESVELEAGTLLAVRTASDTWGTMTRWSASFKPAG